MAQSKALGLLDTAMMDDNGVHGRGSGARTSTLPPIRPQPRGRTIAPPSICVSSAKTIHRSGTLLFRRHCCSALRAHCSCASHSKFLAEKPMAFRIREREEGLCGHDASKSGKGIKKSKLDFMSRRKISGCDRTRPSKPRMKGAWNRAASTRLFSRSGSLHGDPPCRRFLHHPIDSVLLHIQCSMFDSQLTARWWLRIACQRTARGNTIASWGGSLDDPVVFAG